MYACITRNTKEKKIDDWFDIIPQVNNTTRRGVSNKDGVEDPPKSLLFRIQFEIRLYSLSCEEESNLLRGVY
jgi:hypothetical protein